MLLGEALSLRAQQAQKLGDLRNRIMASTLIQEGTTPPENAMTLVDQYLSLSAEHATLVRRITVTNVTTNIPNDPEGYTLHGLLVAREHLTRDRNLHRLVAETATTKAKDFRWTRAEVAFVPAPNVSVTDERQKEQLLNERIAALDAEIQSINWRTTLL